MKRKRESVREKERGERERGKEGGSENWKAR